MRALTLHQPWASLVALGLKRMETRSWGTGFRGPVAIHASKKSPQVGRQLFEQERGLLELQGAGFESFDDLPRGEIVAVCELVDVMRIDSEFWNGEYYVISDIDKGPMTVSHMEHRFGDFTPGRYTWLLSGVQVLDTPVPAKGALGLWEFMTKGFELPMPKVAT